MKRVILKDVKSMVTESVERAPCPADGLVVKVKACGVCATDVKIYNYGHHLLKLPRVLGHEVAGVIAEVGEQVTDRFKVGARVAVCAVVNCGECIYCQRAVPSMCEGLEAFGYHYDGGFQEYMVVPNKAIRCGGVNVLGDRISFAEASIAELLACAINGQHLSDLQLGQSVLIIGSGPVGILHAQLARARGASAVFLVDIDPEKLKMAQKICGPGLTGTIHNSNEHEFLDHVSGITGGHGFDQVMLCCSVGGVQRMSFECVAKMGCVNFFGGLPKGHSMVELDTNHIHYKQCRVVGTHGSSALENRLALQMIDCGLIQAKSLITDTIEVEQLEDALQMNERNAKRLKCVVAFSD